MAMKFEMLSRKVDALAISKTEPTSAAHGEACQICSSPTHQANTCPSLQNYREPVQEQANVAYNYGRTGETYNPGWRNHPNLSWGGQQNQQNQQQSNNYGAPNAYKPPFQNMQPQGQYVSQPPKQPGLEDMMRTFVQTT